MGPTKGGNPCLIEIKGSSTWEGELATDILDAKELETSRKETARCT